MNETQILTALYFGMVATSSNSHGLSLEQCWDRAKSLAEYAEKQTHGKTDQAQVRVR